MKGSLWFAGESLRLSNSRLAVACLCRSALSERHELWAPIFRLPEVPSAPEFYHLLRCTFRLWIYHLHIYLLYIRVSQLYIYVYTHSDLDATVLHPALFSALPKRVVHLMPSLEEAVAASGSQDVLT